MSILVATGQGATMGVLFRNAEAIETLVKGDLRGIARAVALSRRTHPRQDA